MRRRPESGATLVETSISIGFALLLFLLTADVARLVYLSVSMQYVLSRAVRWGILGEPIPGLTREAAIQQRIIDVGNQIGVNMSDATTTICPYTQPNCTVNNAGGPNELIVIKSIKVEPVFWIRKSITLNASVMTKNEPYA